MNDTPTGDCHHPLPLVPATVGHIIGNTHLHPRTYPCPLLLCRVPQNNAEIVPPLLPLLPSAYNIELSKALTFKVGVVS